MHVEAGKRNLAGHAFEQRHGLVPRQILIDGGIDFERGDARPHHGLGGLMRAHTTSPALRIRANSREERKLMHLGEFAT